MRHAKLGYTILALALSLPIATRADDIQEIREATLAHFEAQNQGNAEARIGHHLPYHTQFADGKRLKVSRSIEEQLKLTRKLYNSGIKFDLGLEDISIKIYGDSAVVTGYVVGSVTLANGKVIDANEQRTAVLVKENSEWKEVHVHISPLL